MGKNPLLEGIDYSGGPSPAAHGNPLLAGIDSPAAKNPPAGKPNLIIQRTYPAVGGAYNSSTNDADTPLVKTPRGYGTDLPSKGEVRDHIIPIALGGSSVDSNLEYQSSAEGKYKDNVEFYLIDQVKAGKMSLRDARAKILDWKAQDIPGQPSFNKANAPDMSPLGIAKGAITEIPNTFQNFVNAAKGLLGRTAKPAQGPAAGSNEPAPLDMRNVPGPAKLSQGKKSFSDVVQGVLQPFTKYLNEPLIGTEKDQAEQQSLVNTHDALRARQATGYKLSPEEKKLSEAGAKIKGMQLTQMAAAASGGLETENMFGPTSEIVDTVVPKLEEAILEHPENVHAQSTLDLLKSAQKTGNIHPAMQADILQRIEQIKPEETLGTVEQAKHSIAQNIVDEIINNPAKEITAEATTAQPEQALHEDVVKQAQNDVASEIEKTNPELAQKIKSNEISSVKSIDELPKALTQGLSSEEKAQSELAVAKAVNAVRSVENKATEFSVKNPTLSPKTQMTSIPKETAAGESRITVESLGRRIEGIKEKFRKEAGLMADREGAGVRQYTSDQTGGENRVYSSFKKGRAGADMKKRSDAAKAYAHELLYENNPGYRDLVDQRDLLMSQKADDPSSGIDVSKLFQDVNEEIMQLEGNIKDYESKAEQGAAAPLEEAAGKIAGENEPEKIGIPEPKRTGPVQLNAGIDPGLDKFIEDDLKPFAKSLGQGVAKTWDSMAKLFSPVSRGDFARSSAQTLRVEIAKAARKKELLYNALKKARGTLDRYGKQQSLDFIDKLETGQETPESKQFAQTIRDALQGRWTQIQGIKKTEAYIENYFPHMWKDPEKAGETLAKFFGKRPLEGTKSYLKQRKIPTIKEGVALGLEPVSYNPVDIVMARIVDMDRFLMAHGVVGQFKADGLWKFVKMGDKLPAGWKFIDDKIARTFQFSEVEKGLILRGSYAMPEQAALILHNYLSPGVSSNPIYQALRMSGNSLNQVQLGLSAFHAMFTSMDAVTSKAALELQKVFTDPSLLGKAGHLARFVTSPVAAPYYTIQNFIRGNKLLADYYSKNPEIPQMVDALIKAGGRAQQDSFYKNNAMESMFKALRQGNLPGAALRTPGALIEALSHPIMGYLMPRQKLGVFSDMASHILNTAEREQWTENEVVQRLQEAWDSVDNRMGQMVYDNLFWNKTLKDLGMASTRSLGWNLGTVREVGGGLKDYATIPFKYAYRKFTGKGQDVRMNPRMAYTIALPFVVGMWGAIIYYLNNGKPPQTLLDCYYPTDSKGNRISLPSYMKDIFAYKTEPVQTVANKLQPLLAAIVEMMQNKDYYGSEIRNANDPVVAQIEDELAFVAKQFVPFSLAGAMKAQQQGAGLGGQAASFFGFMPAPGYINQTPMQQKIFAAYQSRFGTSVKTKDETRAAQLKGKIRNAYVNGDTQKANELLKQAIDAGIITAKGAAAFIQNSDIPADVRAFKGLPKEDQANLLRRMSLQDLERYAWYASDKDISGLSDAAKDFVDLAAEGRIREPSWKQGKEVEH